jgi:lysozyme
MAKKKTRTSFNKVKYLKPLPAKGWAIIGAIVVVIGGLIWWNDRTDENQWEFISKFGIKLPLRYAVHGIDVSHHNAKINWDKLKSARSENVSIDFVYIKATEGATHLDRQFKRNWAEAKRVGMKRGAYHFYNPRVMSDRQVDNFIGQVRMEAGDLPPVLDLEVNGGKPDDIIIKGVRNWLTLIEAHYGVKPIIYVNIHRWQLRRRSPLARGLLTHAPERPRIRCARVVLAAQRKRLGRRHPGLRRLQCIPPRAHRLGKFGGLNQRLLLAQTMEAALPPDNLRS